jgi:hypothetical protein
MDVTRVQGLHFRFWLRRRSAAFGLPFFIAVAGCTTFEGLSVVKRDGGGGPSSCHHAHPQQRSEYATLRVEPSQTDDDIAFAVQSLDFGDGANDAPRWDPRTVGFDLDVTCTGEGEGPSCVEPEGKGIAQLDGPDGIDNAASTLQPSRDAGGHVVDSSNETIMAGGATTVYRVSGYNGLAVDGTVDVAAYAADGNGVKRLGDGNDEWRPYVEWTLPAGNGDAGDVEAPFPRFRSVDAYVSDHILVARFDLIMTLPNVRFSNVIVQARLTNDGGLWTMSDGVFAGRMNADDSLQFIEGQQDPVTHKTMCRDSDSYGPLKARGCALADISFSGNDASRPCDAISWAWKFDAVAGHLAAEPNPTIVSTIDDCEPEVSPLNDHCDR